jgi:uncharacterized protein (TIGR00255 family)
MTGFARAQGQGNWGSATFEVRSINHRYLEMSIHLPDTLRELESALRDLIRDNIKRGKIECYIRYQPGEAKCAEMKLNHSLAKQLCQVNDEIAGLLKNSGTINTMDIVRWPGILQIEELDFEVIEDAMIKLMQKALQDLSAMRAREGDELRKIFFQRLDAMEVEVAKAKARIPDILNSQREKLMARFADAKVELDPVRLEQEMVLFTQRIDVTEEIERLATHISETRRLLKQGGMIGRRLDFLMQELHREANTLGSKSAHLDTTRASVELKVLIEQMREQVQNVE